MKRLIFALLCALPIFAQGYTYTYTRTATLNAAAEVVTIQLPGSARSVRAVQFVSASVYCSAECAFTVERDGTAATATAGTITPVSKYILPSIATAFYGSDSVSATVLAGHTIPAGGTLALDLSEMSLLAGGENLTIRTGSMTGTVKINLMWKER